MGRTRCAVLAGTSMELVGGDAASRQHLKWFFGPAMATTPDSPGTQLRITLGEDVAPSVDGTADHVDGPVSCWLGVDHAVFGHEVGTYATVDKQSIAIGRAPMEDGWRVHRQLLFSTLSWWFEAHDALLLHAAAIARDGRAIVLSGPTGAGKSTCVAAALGSGWTVLSDDLVIARSAAGSVEIHGIPKRVSLDPAIVDRIGPPVESVPGDPRMRSMLTVPFSTDRHAVAGLVVVGHHPDDGAVTPLTHHDALAAVLSSWPEAHRDDALRRRLSHVVSLAAVPAFRLDHARRAGVRLEQAAAMLDEIWAVCDESPTAGSPTRRDQ